MPSWRVRVHRGRDWTDLSCRGRGWVRGLEYRIPPSRERGSTDERVQRHLLTEVFKLSMSTAMLNEHEFQIYTLLNKLPQYCKRYMKNGSGPLWW